jgi:hypothetical protein
MEAGQGTLTHESSVTEIEDEEIKANFDEESVKIVSRN